MDNGREHDAKLIGQPIRQLTDLKGRILLDAKVDVNELIFTLVDGQKCKLWHEQECCESVVIEDINGDLADLIDTPLLMVE